MSRRALLSGLAGMAGTMLAARSASATGLVRCFDEATLAGLPGEGRPHPAARGDAFLPPQPFAAGPPVTGGRAGIIRRVELGDGRREIAFTFDLCQTRSPIAGYDGELVDYLRQEDVPATFFPTGRWLAAHRARALQLAADPLFILGNHSFGHPDLHSATADKVWNEILVTEAMLAEIHAEAAKTCGLSATKAATPRLFRFPYGSCADTGIAAANAAGSIVIQWDTVSGDPDGTSATTIVRNVLSHVRAGSIVVMHANGRGTHTPEALRALVPKLRAGGYSFVTVPDLLDHGRPVAATACFIDHPGDTARYDQPKRKPATLPAPASAHT